jgi:hypothetical protein
MKQVAKGDLSDSFETKEPNLKKYDIILLLNNISTAAKEHRFSFNLFFEMCEIVVKLHFLCFLYSMYW